MKRILISIFVVFCVTCSYAQDTSFQIDTAAEKGKRRVAASEPQKTINEAGALLRRSGKLRNAAIAIPIITTVAGGVLTADALYKQNKNPEKNTKPELICGAAVAGVGAFIGLILEIRSNRHLKQAGKKLQQLQFTGTGLTYTF